MLRILLFFMFLINFHFAWGKSNSQISFQDLMGTAYVSTNFPSDFSSNAIVATYSTASGCSIKCYNSVGTLIGECADDRKSAICTCRGKEGKGTLRPYCGTAVLVQVGQFFAAIGPALSAAFREGDRNSTNLTSLIGTGTNDGSYYRIWRATDNGEGKYSQISMLKMISDSELVAVPIAAAINEPSELINFGSDEDHFHIDIYSQEDNITLYYLPEVIDGNGNSTLYCSKIQATTIGQGPKVNLEVAEKYCRSQCSHNVSCE